MFKTNVTKIEKALKGKGNIKYHAEIIEVLGHKNVIE